MSSNPSSSNTCQSQNQNYRELSGETSPVNELERGGSGEQVGVGSLQGSSGENLETFETSSLMKEVENIERVVDDTKSPAVSPPQGSVEDAGANVVPPKPSLLSFLNDHNLTPNPGGILSYFSARAEFKPVNCTVEEPKDVEGHPHAAYVGAGVSKDEVSVTAKDKIDKEKNDEEDEGLSQTSKYNRTYPSSEYSKRGIYSSLNLYKSTGSLKLYVAANERERGAQNTKTLESGSQQMGSSNQVETTKENLPHKRNKEEEEAGAAGFDRDAIGDCSQSQESHHSTQTTRYRTILAHFNEYPFVEGNPMENLDDPFKMGTFYMHNDYFERGALCFEVALRNIHLIPPGSLFEAWYGLAFCRLQTEHNHLAILALKEYLKYIEDDLEGLIQLAVLYVLENCDNLAIVTLSLWLKKNQILSDPEAISPPEDVKEVSSPLNIDFHQKLVKAFEGVKRISGGRTDRCVQWALGLLCYIIKDYVGSEACFKTIIEMDNTDELAWNFLGRSRMETKKYVESLEAYKTALNARPKSSRTRYNMGLTYSKMRNHKEALNQYIQALSRRAEYVKQVVSRLDDSLWRGVKLELCYLGRFDLEEAAINRNIKFLRKKVLKKYSVVLDFADY